MLSPAEIAEVNKRVDLRSLATALGATFRGRKLVGSCPICGDNKSRTSQRFEIVAPDAWACAACANGGDAIKLVMRVKGLGFAAAVDELGGAVKLTRAEAEKREAEEKARRAKSDAVAAQFREAMRKRNYEIWQSAAPLIGSSAEGYLRARGICWRLEALTLKCLEDCPYIHGEAFDEGGRPSARVLHRGPAMLAAFVDAAGRFMSLHRTWIDLARPPKFRPLILDPESGEPLPTKKMRGTKQGGFLRLCEGSSRVRIRAGEGVETTLSAREAMRDDVCYRAGGDLGNLVGPATEQLKHPTWKHGNGRAVTCGGSVPDLSRAAMPVPDECTALTLLEDSDTEPFLLAHAMARGRARFATPTRRVSVAPSGVGRDFNDWLRGIG